MTVHQNFDGVNEGTLIALDCFDMHHRISSEDYDKACYYVGEFIDGRWEYTGFTDQEEALRFQLECLGDHHATRMGKLTYNK